MELTIVATILQQIRPRGDGAERSSKSVPENSLSAATVAINAVLFRSLLGSSQVPLEQ